MIETADTIEVKLYVGSRYDVDRGQLRQTAKQVLAAHGITHAQVDVSIVGRRKIKQLNEQRLKHQGVTDVLSFPQHERHDLHDMPLPEGIPPHLGDVVICYPVALEAARRYGKTVDEQINFFLEHGLMHLMGYHHD